MINVAALQPTDIENLTDTKLNDTLKSEILDSIEQMLKELRADNGANTDRIFMAAQMLGMANVWEQITPAELASRLSKAPTEAVQNFIEGLEHRYAGEVALSIINAVKPASGRYRVPADRYQLVLSRATEAILARASGEQSVTSEYDNLVRKDSRSAVSRLAGPATKLSAGTGLSVFPRKIPGQDEFLERALIRSIVDDLLNE